MQLVTKSFEPTNLSNFIRNKRVKYNGVWFNEDLTVNIDLTTWVNELISTKQRKYTQQYEACLKALLANLVEYEWVLLSRRALKHRKRQYGEVILTKCFNYLKEKNIISVVTGHTGFCTSVKASEVFIKSHEYQVIKEYIAENYISDSEFVVDKRGQDCKEPETVAILKRNLELLKENNVETKKGKARLTQLKQTRVWSDVKNKEGGRLYSRIQREKRQDRPFIKINGQETVEIDYVATHPSLLYAKEGLNAPKDCYEIDGYFLVYRDIVKQTFMLLLNTTRHKAYRKLYAMYRQHPLVMNKKGFFKDLVKSIKLKHAPIEKYFFQQNSLHLQYLDSEIALEVIKRCNDCDIPVIGIHDSFIVPKRNLDDLWRFMTGSFLQVCGKEPRLKIKD